MEHGITGCLYNENHSIPIYEENNHVAHRNLNISLIDRTGLLQIKVKDVSDYSFNYFNNIDLLSFEVIRVNQSLDIDFSEFKVNIVDMLRQFQNKEMFLKCVLTEQSCALIFFTKSKIKHIIYLSLDLKPATQSEIIAEMCVEINNLQEVKTRLQKQLNKAQKIIESKELHLKQLENKEAQLLGQFCNYAKQLELLFSKHITEVEKRITSKITTFEAQIKALRGKVNILKQENHLKFQSNDRLMKTMENLRLENIDNSNYIHELKRENSSLNVLRTTLERNIADLKKSNENLQDANRNLEAKKGELENDLKKLSIIVAQGESKISELSKDLTQANNMLVQFNNRFDAKVSETDELHQALRVKDHQMEEQNNHLRQVLNSFEQYKMNFNEEKFNLVRREMFAAAQKVQELEDEIRKINKINAILTQKVSQEYLLK